MTTLIRLSFLAACALLIVTTTFAQNTPEARQRARRATLTVYENIDGHLRAAVKMFALELPGDAEAKFIRSTYWRQDGDMYAIVKARITQTLSLTESGRENEQDALEDAQLEKDIVQEMYSKDGMHGTRIFDCYLFAGIVDDEWQAFATAEGISSNPAVQKQAVLERTIAKRGEKLNRRK